MILLRDSSRNYLVGRDEHESEPLDSSITRIRITFTRESLPSNPATKVGFFQVFLAPDADAFETSPDEAYRENPEMSFDIMGGQLLDRRSQQLPSQSFECWIGGDGERNRRILFAFERLMNMKTSWVVEGY